MHLPRVSLLRDRDENINLKEEELVKKNFFKKATKRQGLDAKDAVKAKALLCSLVLISMRKSDG